MSMALVRKMLQQHQHVHQQQQTLKEPKQRLQTRKSIVNNNGSSQQNRFSNLPLDDQQKETHFKKRIDDMLFLDHAIGQSSLHTTTKNTNIKEKKKAAKSRINVSNTRSSSSVFTQALKKEPTFNKKREMKQRKIKELMDLAKRMKHVK